MAANENVTIVGCGASQEKIIKRSFDLSFGIIVAILNIIEIIMIAKLKRKRLIHELFLLSLSSSDFLFGLANIFVSTIFLSNSCRFENIFDAIYSFYLFVILASILHLSWIALDRFWCVVHPFQHRTAVTRRRVYMLLAFTWFITIVITVSLHLTEEFSETFGQKETTKATNVVQTTARSLRNRTITGTKSTRTTASRIASASRISREQYKYTVQMTTSVIIIIADVLFIICYGSMVYILNKKSKIRKVKAKKVDRISVICIVIAVTFILFTLPYAMSVFINGVANFGPNLVLISNSGMNCIVYFFRNKCEKYIDEKYQSETSSNVNANESKLSLPNTLGLRKLSDTGSDIQLYKEK